MEKQIEEVESDVCKIGRAILNARKIDKLHRTFHELERATLDTQSISKFSAMRDCAQDIARTEVKAIRGKIAHLDAHDQTRVMEDLILGHVPAF